MLNGDGIARSVGYCAPVVSGSLGFKLTSNFKVSGELHVSGSDSITINDVSSQVANVGYAASGWAGTGSNALRCAL